jgi:micrococcal nuclease
MKIIFLLLYIFFIPIMSELSAQPIFSGVVTKIIDGDSIVVKKGKKYIEVRMYGIDCPEWNQHFSIEARDHTTSLLYNQKITLIPQYHDSYGRLVALLVKDGQDVNGELVRSGVAWVYPRYCRKKVCKSWLADQEIARKEGRGLWKKMVQ